MWHQSHLPCFLWSRSKGLRGCSCDWLTEMRLSWRVAHCIHFLPLHARWHSSHGSQLGRSRWLCLIGVSRPQHAIKSQEYQGVGVCVWGGCVILSFIMNYTKCQTNIKKNQHIHGNTQRNDLYNLIQHSELRDIAGQALQKKMEDTASLVCHYLRLLFSCLN